MKRAVVHGFRPWPSFCVEVFGTERLLNLTNEEAREQLADLYACSLLCIAAQSY
jgi:hypothetical protein